MAVCFKENLTFLSQYEGFGGILKVHHCWEQATLVIAPTVNVIHKAGKSFFLVLEARAYYHHRH
jgi:hypothetical protein